MSNLGYNPEMDEFLTTERILDRMTDPKEIEKRKIKKQEKQRVSNLKSKFSL